MGANSKIEWTDHTFNPWRGCAHAVQAGGAIHPACEHCYAETMSKRNPAVLGRWGADGTRVRADDKMWREPIKWNAAAQAEGIRRRVFCASLADVFEEWGGLVVNTHGEQLLKCCLCTARYYPDTCESDSESCDKCGRFKQRMEWATLYDLRRDLFALIDATPWLEWLLLTKRPENVRRMWPAYFPGGYTAEAGRMNQEGPRPNVWLGTSISDQATADEWVPKLLACRDLAPVLFLSIEPLLGPVDLGKFLPASGPQGWRNELGIDWAIAGGESGPHARPMHPDWPRSIRDQCQSAGVPFFFKQWGEWGPSCNHGSGDVGVKGKPEKVLAPYVFYKIGKAKAGRLLDGREWSEFPQAFVGGAVLPGEGGCRGK